MSTKTTPAINGSLTGTHLSPWRFWVICLGICLGLFLSMLDSSIVATSLLTIGADLGSVSLLNWVALAYTLAYLGCCVIFARISDVVGRRPAYMSAFVLFFCFSLGGGFARTIHQLIVCRTLQGIGGSGLYSLSMVILLELAPDHLKQHIASLAGVVVAMAGVLGPVLGGVLTHSVSWRWIFWINCPIAAVSIGIFALFWPKKENLPETQLGSWKELDIVGSLLLIAAAVLVTFAFQNASTNGAQWAHAIFLAPFITGVFCWTVLFAWESVMERRWPHILAAFPLTLVRNRVYAAALVHTMLLGFSSFTVIYAFPTRMQVVNDKTALIAGLTLLPMLGGVAFGSYLAGAISARYNRIFEILAGSSCLVALGCGLEMTVPGTVSLPAKALGFLPFIGLGAGLTAAAATILTSIEAPPGEHAPAQGILAQIRVLGGSIGIAASSAVLAAQEVAKLGGVLAGSVSLTSGENAADIRDVYAAAYREDMCMCTAVAAASLIAACGTYRRDRKPIFPTGTDGAEDGDNGTGKAAA